jgi:hypothetical protein
MDSVIIVMKALVADPNISDAFLKHIGNVSSLHIVQNPNVGSTSTAQRKKRQRTNKK